jgi:hypothetical protein
LAAEIIFSSSGKHTRFFYQTIQNKQLDKDIFDLDSTNIGLTNFLTENYNESADLELIKNAKELFNTKD